MKTHGPYPYTGTARGAKENRAAHGNVCFVDVRPDGSWRERNVNQQHSEVGSWQRPMPVRKSA